MCQVKYCITICPKRRFDPIEQCSSWFSDLLRCHSASQLVWVLPIEIVKFLFEQTQLILSIEQEPRLKVAEATIDHEALATVLKGRKIWVPIGEKVYCTIISGMPSRV